MRMIGTIPTAEQAERFSDYLLTQQIENMVEETRAGDWAVWVEHDDHLDRAKGELISFLKNPADPQYDAAAKAQEIRKEEEKKQKRLRRQYVDVRTRWGQPRQWATPLTLLLIAISVIASFVTGSVGLGQRREAAIDPLLFTSVQPQRYLQWQVENPSAGRSRLEVDAGYWLSHLRRGEIWRVVTPIFIHWHLLHLLFNMFWTRDLGGMIEIQRGTRRLLALVLLSAVISNLAQYFWSGPSAFGGMSGVVYALFGYVWIKMRYEPHLGLGISQQAIWIMMGWLVVAMTGIIGIRIANTAHVVGLLVGAAFAYAPIAWRQIQRRRRT